MKKLLIAACAVAITLVACKDDKDSTPAPTNGGTSALVGKDWLMTGNSTTVKGSGFDTTINHFDDMEACEKDDLVRFNADKTITEKAGATKCNSSDPDTEQGGTWDLSSDNKKLTITTPDDGPETVDVVTLNETSLVVSRTESDNGFTGTTTISFKKN